MKKIAASAAVLSWLMLAGCGTNSRIPEIREASFNRAATPAAADASHEVRLGDTLYSIAWRYNIDYHDLARWNDIQPPYMLHAGQKLRLSAPAATSSANAVQVKPLPSSDSMSVPANTADDNWLISAPVKAPVSSGTSVSGEAVKPSAAAPEKAPDSVPTMAPVSSNGPVSPAVTAAKTPETAAQTSAETAWLWPTKGTVIGHFGDPSDITSGLDIAGQKGQPVIASRSGTVVYAGNNVRGYGNLVIIKHDDHFLSAYAHNDTLKVKDKDIVKAGQVIATLGDTEADRAKLHFEIRQDSQPKDPQQFLPRS